MTYRLVPHPDRPARTIESVNVRMTRLSDGGLRLSYLVSGPVAALALPSGGVGERRDGLWQTTCFEVFVSAGAAYIELNLSPSSAWAAYRFAGVRSGMALLEDVEPPAIDQNGGSGWYELIAEWRGLPLADEAAVGLSAVIEETDGTKSYWALAHPPGPPDFHNPACFIATLPAPPKP